MGNNEIWKPVKGYEGLYEVSNCGRVRSLNYYGHAGLMKVMKGVKTTKGYLQVGLRKDGKKKMYLVHRLVYEAFRGKIPEGLQVNHLDECKTNNWLDNLEVCTCKENLNYGTRNERAVDALKKVLANHPSLSKAVQQIDIVTGKILNTYPSAREAERQTGVNQSSIAKCCKGKFSQSGGYLWRYAEDVY